MRVLSMVLVLLVSISFVGYASTNEVTLYTSFDQIFSEPIIKDFEKTTGIKVKAVYDSEATKTVGLVNRLIAEKNNPQADVFWNSEVGRTIVLKNKGVLDKYVPSNATTIPAYFKDKDGYWTGFAARARVLVYNTKMVKATELPKTLNDLLKPQWKGKVCMANPLFGSTATHYAALFRVWGDVKTKKFCRDLKANGVVLVDGNSVVRDKVGAGQYPIGITDTDDANSGMLSGMPIKMSFLDQGAGEIGTFVMPNTVCMIKKAPHRKNAERLMEYLLSSEVEMKLAKGESLQIPLHTGLKAKGILSIDQVKAMKVNFVEIGNTLEMSSRFLQEVFAQ